jgi:hypothetical protein
LEEIAPLTLLGVDVPLGNVELEDLLAVLLAGFPDIELEDESAVLPASFDFEFDGCDSVVLAPLEVGTGVSVIVAGVVSGSALL